jgi:formylglycine-generating enzyme
MNRKLIAITLMLAACPPSSTHAERVHWEAADGGNGHWYEVLTGPPLPNGVPGVVTWEVANFNAQLRGGYLATIASAAENQFVFRLSDSPMFWWTIETGEHFGPWLGGAQAPGALNPASDWLWVTGEPFTYTHWHPGEPNDLFGILDENRLVYFAVDSSAGSRSAYWNDESDAKRNVIAYVVEYIPDPASLALTAIGLLCLTFSRRPGRSIGATAMLLAMIVLVADLRAITIDTVPVGNPGNAGELSGGELPGDPAIGLGPVGIVGAVSYEYRIGKYEVTNAQYTEFLNAVDPTGANLLGLYNIAMSSSPRSGINVNNGAANGSKYLVKSGRDYNPVVLVSWYDAFRFANWLHNGQGSGDTETGAYTLLGGTPIPTNGSSIVRNPGATWFLPNENEWYKAAYHKNDGVTGNYWDYATATDSTPYSDQPPGIDAPDSSNTANYYRDDNAANGYDDGFAITGSTSFEDLQNYLNDAGAYTQSVSAYGTLGQGGNVWEWNETLINSPFRGMRGGGWDSQQLDLAAMTRYDGGAFPVVENNVVGFRVACIPEPGTLLLAALATVGFLTRNRPDANALAGC